MLHEYPATESKPRGWEAPKAHSPPTLKLCCWIWFFWKDSFPLGEFCLRGSGTCPATDPTIHQTLPGMIKPKCGKGS